ncbi:MAG TPA: hypothetical protein VMO20_09130, partial [Candidatus Acidoferrum sp.]|nr:hypothetical protein [Candidatus Acidoferrum sp.]
MKNYAPCRTHWELANRPPLLTLLYLTLLTLCALWLPEKAFGTGSWVAMSTTAPGGVGICLLLPDGTILAEGSSSNWYSLAPDSAGHYTDGNWSTRNNSTWGHQTGSTA